MVLREKMKEYDKLACHILATGNRKGRVVLLTNSWNGWAWKSAKDYLPKTYEYMTDKNNLIHVFQRPSGVLEAGCCFGCDFVSFSGHEFGS